MAVVIDRNADLNINNIEGTNERLMLEYEDPAVMLDRRSNRKSMRKFVSEWLLRCFMCLRSCASDCRMIRRLWSFLLREKVAIRRTYGQTTLSNT
jgi:hypothetical protein